MALQTSTLTSEEAGKKSTPATAEATRPIPPIDRSPPKEIETATFAMG